MLRAAFAIALCAACGKAADDECSRAIARLERIGKERKSPAVSNANAAALIEGCRTAKHASHDPVLRCAIDSATDEAASACIDRFVRDVVTPGAGDGSGVNPLLQP